MRRATKIVATLGPASSSPEVLERMIRAGVDVVRMNFSHGKAPHRTYAPRAPDASAARFSRISNAGSVLPSSTSRNAPPPVEM